MAPVACPVCQSGMKADRPEAVWYCDTCNFYRSNLPVVINVGERIDEVARQHALSSIREANFRRLLDKCGSFLPPEGVVLDVGCAHGWFLEKLSEHGYRAVGLEPDTALAAQARAAGFVVFPGFFPDDLPDNSSFDAITFNDVLEHLPELPQILSAIDSSLAPSGVVIVNLPLSEGFIFRMARFLDRFGFHSPLQRMWQVGLPSPHLSYFSSSNLSLLFQNHGFELVHRGNLDSVVTKGLYQRIRFDRGMGAVSAGLIYAAMIAVRPLLRFLPRDIGYFVFRRQDRPQATLTR